MLKLVEAYAEYDKVSAPGPEILQAKSEIENTLDTINDAFTQLLNNLFQDSVWDVTSDAKVLTTMLTQEGLTQEAALKTK
jgi:5-bromo-4-chloroindolyl phosphate hydrolysis protein